MTWQCMSGRERLLINLVKRPTGGSELEEIEIAFATCNSSTAVATVEAPSGGSVKTTQVSIRAKLLLSESLAYMRDRA